MNRERLLKIVSLLEERELEALIVDAPIDLYYLLGHDLSLGRLVVSHKGATLFVDGRYYEACSAIEGIDVILTMGYDEGSAFASWWPHSGKNIGFDADATTYTQFEALKKLNASLFPLKSPIKKIRAIKDGYEINKLKAAADLNSKGYDFVCSLLKEGVTEKEIAYELEFFWRRLGGEKVAFAPHIAFGEGSSQPHYHSTDRPLKKGDLVLIDIGVVYLHYFSDMTRVVFYGEPNKELKKIYQIVFEAQARAVAHCRPGTTLGELDWSARNYIENAGYKEFFPHSLGHGVGLEIHELPAIRSQGVERTSPLEAGMVITIEPGIYLPGRGGVRLEDTVLITETGYENLTNRALSPLPHIIN